jgi:hypothetical protein
VIPQTSLPARIEGVEEQTQSYRLITAAEDLAAVAGTLREAEAIGVDVETTALSPRDGKGTSSSSWPPRTRRSL